MAAAGEAGVAAVGNKAYTGSCLCGAVSYRAVGLSDIWYCHCKQCQKLTGRYIAAAGVKREDFDVTGEVNWLPISEKSNSGHCKSCGSYMFWDAHSFDTVSILAGSIDDTQGLAVKGHIYVSEKGDYYEITDGLPQYDTYPPDGTR
ncbi:MAG: GFA family protein [Hellea sp.]